MRKPGVIAVVASSMIVWTLTSSVAMTARAQSQTRAGATALDGRWYAWLGCWRADSSAAGASVKCIVPATGTNTVDEITAQNGRVIARDRLDLSGRPHHIREQGCDGSESVAMSRTEHRVYLRSDYACATGIKGTSTRLFAMLASGEWLEVENVQSGGGGIVHAERRKDVGVPADLPREIVSRLVAERLAITTARASVATPLTSDDVLDALQHTDASTTRAWLAVVNQHFDLDGTQLAALVHSDVPASVLQAMMASAPQRQLGIAPQGSEASDTYLNTPVYSPSVSSQVVPVGYGFAPSMMTVPCTAAGCFEPSVYAPNGYSAYNGAGYYPSYPYAAVAPYASRVPYPVYGGPIIVRRGNSEFHHGPSVPRTAPNPPGPIGRRP